MSGPDRTLEALREVALARFGPRVTPPRLLLCWAEDPDARLLALLKAQGLDLAWLRAALEPLQGDTSELHRGVSIKARLLGGAQPLAVHLLAALVELPQAPLALALVAAGLDLAALGRALLAEAAPSTPPRLEVAFEHGRDLTAAAERGDFDGLAERPEVELLVNALLRWRKGNPVLLGPAGVGKTALVELLARRLSRDAVPTPLRHTRLFELRLGALIAGTRLRGEFEGRLEAALARVRAHAPALLFIDELHLLKGLGRAEGAADGAELLKPALSRGEIRLIGATTDEEYQRAIAPDAALARRLDPIHVSAPDQALCAQMVAAQAQVMATHHGLHIPPTRQAEAVTLTDRHVAQRQQPDKALDLLDRACVLALREGREVVSSEDLRLALSAWTKLPLAQLDLGRPTAGLMAQLSASVKGQSAALGALVDALAPRLLNLGDEARPQAALLFTGGSGVGKTSTARALSQALFGDGALLRLDLSEYNTPTRVNTLLGAPPGYQGGDQDGLLGGFLAERGAGVVLLDELEKAHPDVIQAFLGVLDTGALRSARGLRFDARSFLFIATTNAAQPRRKMGFGASREGEVDKRALGQAFPPELLGRMDAVIAFEPLSAAALREIARGLLGALDARLAQRGVILRWSLDEMVDFVMAGLDAPAEGARAVRRRVEQRVLGPIARAVLSGARALEINPQALSSLRREEDE
ncbi:ATP-dependent Clp protease ATP-binding subunit [Myxococcota bacterium]|nr:ATP-dependent Clp protease ATP-binding subunit [Myxococcota bacterium]MBU1433234.1 ATP-dependent Clp protease ATP-binding subunit [Myxococcota bacterium]MBU1896633.1 ATP-dependent Clp protease ATP-binding subunit [Myxococcota bacterium]